MRRARAAEEGNTSPVSTHRHGTRTRPLVFRQPQPRLTRLIRLCRMTRRRVPALTNTFNGSLVSASAFVSARNDGPHPVNAAIESVRLALFRKLFQVETMVLCMVTECLPSAAKISRNPVDGVTMANSVHCSGEQILSPIN